MYYDYAVYSIKVTVFTSSFAEGILIVLHLSQALLVGTKWGQVYFSWDQEA